jgi:hypothetical protein
MCSIHVGLIFVHQAFRTMKFKTGDRVSFEAKHLSGAVKASFVRQHNDNDIDSLEVRGKVVGRAPAPARRWKIAVDGGHGAVFVSSSKQKKVESATQARPDRARNAVNYCEDGYETEAEVGEDSECEASTEEDSEDDARQGPRGQELPNRQNRNPTRNRDGPVTAASVTLTDWKRVEAIAVDEREGNIQKGRLIGDCIDTLTHAQMFLKFFPLHVFEPLVPKWQHAAKSKESPLSGMPEITMSLFVGWLALWVAMMVVHLPGRNMYWNSLQDPIYSCPIFHEWGLHRYFEELFAA